MKKYQGFSLVEVIISGALVATTAGGLFAASTTATRLTTLGQDRVIASQLAREGIEIVRQVRDTTRVSQKCEPALPCADWRDRIVTQQEAQNLSRQAIAKAVELSASGFALKTISLENASCSDIIRRDTLTIDPSLRNQPSDFFCRRIFIEPVADPALAESALRVRSQVAWIGSGRNLLTLFGGNNTVSTDNRCNLSSDEWCTEQVTLLTDWSL